MAKDGYVTVRPPEAASQELDDVVDELNAASAALPPALQQLARKPHAFTKGEAMYVAVRVLREYLRGLDKGKAP